MAKGADEKHDDSYFNQDTQTALNRTSQKESKRRGSLKHSQDTSNTMSFHDYWTGLDEISTIRSPIRSSPFPIAEGRSPAS